MYKLLIADDEIIEREFLNFVVNQNFAGVLEVCEAANGRELLQKAATFKPDIVITDIKMPGINGLEAAARIREIFPECKIILMSALQYFNYAKEGFALGVVDYLTKPISTDVIINTLNKLIQQIEDSRVQRKKDNEINTKLKSVTQYLSEELIFLMSSGEIKEDTVKEFFQILDIKSNAFICAVVSFSDDGLPDDITGEVQKRMIKKRVSESLINKLLHNGLRFLNSSIGQYTFLLILIDEAMDEFEARIFGINIFNTIKDEIFNELLTKLNVGIGKQCTSISQIYTSFLEAKIALKYDVSPGTIISYGDIGKKSMAVEYPLNKERHLLEMFLQGDENSCVQIVDELMDWMSIHLYSLESIKQKTYELILVLIREAIMNFSFTKIEIDTEKMRTELFLFDTTREIRSFAKVYLKNRITDINNIKTSKVNSLLSIVTQYISNNFDKSISLESVSAIVKVSPFYLSKLFKKEIGMNFIDYLTDFRIRRSKELLSIPTHNVKEVCYLVGYKDPNYFARVFKKICGISPTEYRDKIYYRDGAS